MEWQARVVVPIFRKGDWRICSSYEGITLLRLALEVNSVLLERRLLQILEPWFKEEQCGFRPCCGTVDQRFTLIGLLYGSLEFTHPV